MHTPNSTRRYDDGVHDDYYSTLPLPFHTPSLPLPLTDSIHQGAGLLIVGDASRDEFTKAEVELFIQRHGGKILGQPRSKQMYDDEMAMKEKKRKKMEREMARKRKRGEEVEEGEGVEVLIEEDEDESKVWRDQYVIAPRGVVFDVRLSRYRSYGYVNCVDGSWPLDCVTRGKMLEPKPSQYIFMSESVNERYKQVRVVVGGGAAEE